MDHVSFESLRGREQSSNCRGEINDWINRFSDPDAFSSKNSKGEIVCCCWLEAEEQFWISASKYFAKDASKDFELIRKEFAGCEQDREISLFRQDWRFES